MYIRLLNLEITASRWPWQEGYNWKGSTQGYPLNPINDKIKASPRFGAGWSFSLGINVGGSGTVMLNLLYGVVTIRRPSSCVGCGEPIITGDPCKWEGYNKFHYRCYIERYPEGAHQTSPAKNEKVPF